MKIKYWEDGSPYALLWCKECKKWMRVEVDEFLYPESWNCEYCHNKLVEHK